VRRRRALRSPIDGFAGPMPEKLVNKYELIRQCINSSFLGDIYHPGFALRRRIKMTRVIILGAHKQDRLDGMVLYIQYCICIGMGGRRQPRADGYLPRGSAISL
jgi:hypothetical protein